MSLPLLWAFQSNAFHASGELKLVDLSEILASLSEDSFSSPRGMFSALTRGLGETTDEDPAVAHKPMEIPALTGYQPNFSPASSTLPFRLQANEWVSEYAESAPPQDPAWLSITVKSGDNLSTIFADNGLNRTELHQILELGETVESLRWLRPGQTIRIKRTRDGSIDALLKEIDFSQELRITRAEAGDKVFVSSIEERDLNVERRQLSGSIDSSLFAAAQEAGLPDRLVLQLVQIFGWDIDFALDIQPDDSFSVVFDEYYAEGKRVKTGEILAARFVNNGQVYEAVRYTDSTGFTAYYTPEGDSMQKAFLRTPVKIGLVTSGFQLARYHPVLNETRAHKGVDYGAPTGTPVYTTGNGRVAFKGRKSGYGMVVEIQHGEKYSTLYGHLSKFAADLEVGDRVRQGELIGYVGQTGLATGPHLHYEFRVDGEHKNPLTVKLPKAMPLEADYRKDFVAKAQPLLSELRATAVAQANAPATGDTPQTP